VAASQWTGTALRPRIPSEHWRLMRGQRRDDFMLSSKVVAHARCRRPARVQYGWISLLLR
jgi:hypothetical protein